MALASFHPAVARWFTERIGQPTPAQIRGWEAIRRGDDTLIAAPTGSGKTLAAFLIGIDRLLEESLAGNLPDAVQVIYVSPLKALSADIHHNLAEPRREIRRIAESMDLGSPHLTAAIRSGDTTAAERAAIIRTPPHILVTTPESLYLLLTAERSRKVLATARTVIVDEIHALLESRRGAHLALSLERLDHVAGRRLQRVGLSATQRPIEAVADWLTGTRPPATIVDEGHRRELDLGLEVPGSPLQAVMSAEVWAEVYDRVATLATEHRTTLVFVNTRRLAERVAHQLAARLGRESVTAHHGSLSKEIRLDAEARLKNGQLRVLVATASLELGIDIGHVDLVCQLGSPRRIATFLQRVGRSGHTVRGRPKGRLFPLSRDELVECAALLDAVGRGELDRVEITGAALDVLAQQLVAETAAEQWDADRLFELVRGAWPYRALPRERFDAVVAMLANGYVTRRGRRGALVHHDTVNRRVRGRRGARLAALTSGGAIPDNADYRVVLEPEGTFVGTLNEDFAVESTPGDIFQLGNTSWRMLRIERGVVRAEDARGQPPSLPFWLGEAPSRSTELSAEVARLRGEVGRLLDDRVAATAWLEGRGLPAAAASQMVDYLGEGRRLLGVLPTQETLVAERSFDESGGMQLVIHSPFGGRVNRAWGLALRKRFCRQFNFELQAAATDDAVLLSLGPQHSFPLESVFRFLNTATVREILIQAMLDAPIFATRWRWNANISLAVPRFRSGKRVAPQIQRMEADDLLAAAFPDAAACLENIPGDRAIPEHPLVEQVIADCLHEAMDLDRLGAILGDLDAGRIRFVARDLPEPSPLAHEILNARPYAFLDDAPLEERRTQAVYTRRAFEPGGADDLGALDADAIARVRDEAWPEVEHADELHDALVVSGFLTDREGSAGRNGVSWLPFFEELLADGRAVRVGDLWVAAERAAEARAVPSDVDALRELLRGRLEIVGPTTVMELADSVRGATGPAAVDSTDAVAAALAALEADGAALRGRFTPGRGEQEWCDRRLLARIHRYTLNRLRAEIEPVSTGDFQRFLLGWQRVAVDERVAGLEGLAQVIEQLAGFEAPAGAWEVDLLAARCEEYDPALLDALSLTGRVAWARLSAPTGAGAARQRPIRTSPVALLGRADLETLLALAGSGEPEELSSNSAAVRDALRRSGASFLPELARATGLLPTQVEQALGELAAAGLVTSDGFAGLRALLTPSAKRPPLAGATRRHRTASFGFEAAGRWSLLDRQGVEKAALPADELERYARMLLARYGVVFHRLLAREALALPWRALLTMYRRLEARGEIRGGRFVAGVTGEQFALPEAVPLLRAARRAPRHGALVAISAADPLNLAGILTPGERVPAVASNRILFEDGMPIAVLEAGQIRLLAEVAPERRRALEIALTRRSISPALRARMLIAGRGPDDTRRRRERPLGAGQTESGAR
ncbi:MAG: DEAD/DEAH box helicase [Gemmatimonadales bacterium]